LFETRILTVRGYRVMLDSHLGEPYGVTTGNLSKAVARNALRFPDDFMFQVVKEELTDLKFQNGISSPGHGRRREPSVELTSGPAKRLLTGQAFPAM
jgi:hypothetical protein